MPTIKHKDELSIRVSTLFAKPITFPYENKIYIIDISAINLASR